MARWSAAPLLLLVLLGAAAALLAAASASGERKHLVSLRAGDGGQWITEEQVRPCARARQGTERAFAWRARCQ